MSELIEQVEEVQPEWMVKINNRHIQNNKRFAKAMKRLADAWMLFQADIENINQEFGTVFTVEETIETFTGKTLESEVEEDDDDDDDDDET